MKAEKMLIIFVAAAAVNHNICYEKLFANRRNITLCVSILDE